MGANGVLGNKNATSERQRAFVWGMALHTLADTFAHSALVYKADGTLKYLSHNPEKGEAVADIKSAYEERYENAVTAVQDSIRVYNSHTTGGQYVSGSCYAYTSIFQNNGVYVLYNLSRFVSEAGYGWGSAFNPI